MYRQNSFFPRYSNLRYNNYVPSYYTTNTSYASYEEICNNENNVTPTNDNANLENSNLNENSQPNNETRSEQNDYNNNRFSLFGLPFELDDLILIALILLLFLESYENNIALIIILGLMLFNVNLSSLNIF